MKCGSPVLTPLGTGRVAWVRMRDCWPYTEPEWVSVVLDDPTQREPLGTVFPIAQVKELTRERKSA